MIVGDMIQVVGAYNTAICFTSELECAAREQIQAVCDRFEFADCRIRIMPDVHAGMGCTIGTTMTITDKIVPGMVGVDIGCGMETVRLADKSIDYAALDRLIRRRIPSGRGIRDSYHQFNELIDLTKLRCVREVKLERARKSIGTLGGGNHFIEVAHADGAARSDEAARADGAVRSDGVARAGKVDREGKVARSDSGDLYLVVHSGSRHIGNEVAVYYQDQACKSLQGVSKLQVEALIATLKAEGRQSEISETVRRLKASHADGADVIPKDLTYVSGELFDDYLHDMKLIQQFAALNRKAMVEVILQGMGLQETDRFTTIHNYVDTDSMILRKGAVSARAGETLLIPINMRDGSLICIGKGNEDWNFSAPHGAGRLMSRKAAFKALSMEEYRLEMSGVYTSSVNTQTLDESPMAYKSIDEIISHIEPTVEIVERIYPTYNFKASE